MKLKVLGSSSASNGYILKNENEALILECGCPIFAAEKAMHFRLGNVVGCLVTHEHGDHAGHINDYARYMPIYCTAGTAVKCGIKEYGMTHIVTPLKPVKIGGFTVLPFPTQHDAQEPCGYFINHPDIGNLLFATDTYYLRFKFEQLNHIMIECNYDREILARNVRDGIVSRSVMNRVIKSHFSIDNCIKSLQSNDLTQVRSVFLIHLSSNNSDRVFFPKKVAAAIGKPVIVAEKNAEYELF